MILGIDFLENLFYKITYVPHCTNMYRYMYLSLQKVYLIIAFKMNEENR